MAKCCNHFKSLNRLHFIHTALTVTSEGLKRNCLLRLDFSMVSMSVTMTSPSPQASPIMAKFFNNSQPIAPAPTWCCENPVSVNWQHAEKCKSTFVLAAYQKIALLSKSTLQRCAKNCNLAIITAVFLQLENKNVFNITTCHRKVHLLQCISLLSFSLTGVQSSSVSMAPSSDRHSRASK